MEIANLKKCCNPMEIGRYCDDDEKLTWMIFLDGCAVLQAIFLRYAPDIEVQEDTNELNIKNDLLTFVCLYLFLLQNQLPYRVLELLTSSSNHGKKFKESIKMVIDNNVMAPAEMKKQQRQWQKQEKQKLQQQQGKQQKQQQEREPAHLLGLLRARLVVIKEEKRSPFQSCGCHRLFRYRVLNKQKRMRSHHSHTFRNVKVLREAGIWLRPSETSCLKDISFNRVCCVGKPRLPPITVDDSKGSKFMNLIAYEMCPDFDNDFAVTSYICFLDSLID
ncbi:hypothetical protein CRYUN_Cryun09bG0145900 [Craigia yunnanensis]